MIKTKETIMSEEKDEALDGVNTLAGKSIDTIASWTLRLCLSYPNSSLNEFSILLIYDSHLVKKQSQKLVRRITEEVA